MAKTPGQIATAKAKKVRGQVNAYFRKNRFATQQDCARDLGISKTTVFRHVQTLKREEEEKRNAAAAGE